MGSVGQRPAYVYAAFQELLASLRMSFVTHMSTSIRKGGGGGEGAVMHAYFVAYIFVCFQLHLAITFEFYNLSI